MRLRAGDRVEVRSKEEILRTLDTNGRLEGLPFMPQMFQYCGEQFEVYKRAHKTCDTVNDYHSRRLTSGVHLNTRCDGEAHEGCQAACLIFWKEQWLKPINKKGSLKKSTPHCATKRDEPIDSRRCTESDVRAAARAEKQQPTEETRVVCQATNLPDFTTPLQWWDLRQYLEDYTSGNVTLTRMFSGFVYAGYFILYRRLSRYWWRFGMLFRWFYNRSRAIRGGFPFPRRVGTIIDGQPTPTCDLNLQPGELVRVKPLEEILATLDEKNKNRGLYFDAELVPYCGGTYRVRTRLNKFVDERTGKIITTKNVAIILEDVWCQARYSDCRLFCPRSIYPWWREIWLERVY